MSKMSGYSLSFSQPMELEKGCYVLNVPKGKQYRIELVVEYYAPSPCKFFANLYPDAKDHELHLMGAHFDTVTSYGVPVVGRGQLSFSLSSIACSPSWFQSKKIPKEIVIGLMDYEKWMAMPPFCMRNYSFILKSV